MFTPVNTVVGNHFFLLPLNPPELLMFVCIHCRVPDYSVTWDTRSLPLTIWPWRRAAVALCVPRVQRGGVLHLPML